MDKEPREVAGTEDRRRPRLMCRACEAEYQRELRLLRAQEAGTIINTTEATVVFTDPTDMPPGVTKKDLEPVRPLERSDSCLSCQFYAVMEGVTRAAAITAGLGMDKEREVLLRVEDILAALWVGLEPDETNPPTETGSGAVG